jgi:gamma-glutamylcyclotransferase (GGCT)/AIG2-like uncharacterized protein YtfP
MHTNNKIFVYGTLMNGFLQDVLPGIQQFVKRKRKGTIQARLFDLGDYPAARQTTIDGKFVYGELYELDPAHMEDALVKLDDYEEYHPTGKLKSLYVRKLTPVITANAVLNKAWVYWYNRPVKKGKEIETGDYKKYILKTKSKFQ